MHIDGPWECWTPLHDNMRTRTRGEKGRHLWPRLVQTIELRVKPLTNWAGKYEVMITNQTRLECRDRSSCSTPPYFFSVSFRAVDRNHPNPRLSYTTLSNIDISRPSASQTHLFRGTNGLATAVSLYTSTFIQLRGMSGRKWRGRRGISPWKTSRRRWRPPRIRTYFRWLSSCWWCSFALNWRGTTSSP